MSTPAIETDGLSKCYGDTVGIEGLDLEVHRGEVLGFLGPNGAGKTTTIRLLLDLIRPSSGSAQVLGFDCQEESLQVRARVGYLPGELALWDDATGRWHLEHLAKLRGGVDPRTVEQMVERFGVQLDKPTGSLSRGNKQKIGLVQAFMGAPELLLLDEPTSGLDPLMQQEVLSLVEEVRDQGRTVFFSSHHLHEVERACDRVAIVRDGRLVAVEAVDRLLFQGARRVEIRFRGPVDREVFEGLDGVHELRVDDNLLSCTVEGSMDALFKAAARLEIQDVRTPETELEDVFLSYYGGGEDA